MSNKVVIIDNGHGYNTPGKRAIMPNGIEFEEWEFTRFVKLRLITKLYKINHSFFDLVPESYDVSLSERVRRINNYVKLKNVKPFVLSIHGDAYTNKDANGVTVFTSKGLTKSDKIANIFVEELKKLEFSNRYSVNKERLKGREENFYILRKTNCPAILTELGFYTNPDNVVKMHDDIFQEKIADLLLRAILRVDEEL